ncbi:MAG: WYL domain-containing protein [Prevotella sp.]|nr:WYL domain-containing protein [Prevotella sp.]
MHRIERQLDIILTLIDGSTHTIEELCKTFKMTQRNLYYTFQKMRDYGFYVKKERKGFYLDFNSPFFRQVAHNINFSNDEAIYIYKIMETVKPSNRYTESICNKLHRAYDLGLITDKKRQERTARNTSRLLEAINRKRVVVLKKYSSPHSNTQSDRTIEPFTFMSELGAVRGYELATHQNKTFKLSRAKSVEIIEDIIWNHEYMNKPIFTDLFLFSGEERHHIRIRMGRLSSNLLLEEYPHSAAFLTPDGPDHWLLETDVTSYVGIGRFLIGLADDIEILEDDGLRKYLRERLEILREKIGEPNPAPLKDDPTPAP